MEENKNFEEIETKNIVQGTRRLNISRLTVVLAASVIFLLVLLILLLLGIGRGGDKDTDKSDSIYLDSDGYVVVNGVRTEYKSDTPDRITVSDGFLFVNGTKTEYEVKPSSHTYGDWLAYGEDGFDCEITPRYRLCSDCGSIEWREGEYADHSFELLRLDSTCKDFGYDMKVCRACEKQEIVNELPKSLHTLGGYTSDGTFHWQSCSVCNTQAPTEAHTLGDDGLCSICSAAIEDTPGVVYDLSADGSHALVVDYKGSSSTVKIASEYQGVPVKIVYDNAFYQNKGVKTVIIPDSVTEIGSWVFYECYALTDVVFSSSLEIIGSLAFCHTGLSEIVLPDSLVKIGSDAFSGCSSLTTAKLGDGVQIIEQRAFYNCKSLKSVSVGKNVAYVQDRVFDECNEELFTEYNYVKYVGDSENPYGVAIDVTNTSFSSYEIHESTRAVASEAFMGCERLTSLVFPEGFKGIGSESLRYCDALEYIYLPKSLTHMAWWFKSTVVYYEGSEEDWQNIQRFNWWGEQDGSITVHYNFNREDL